MKIFCTQIPSNWPRFFLLTLFVTLFLGSSSGSTTYSQDPSLRDIMQRKLDHAHNILDSLAVEDFDGLAESARELERLVGEATWLGQPDAAFTAQLQRFRWSIETLRLAADDRDIDAAALGYVDMTLRCVQCHKNLRGTRNARH